MASDSPLTGRLRAYWLGTVVCMSGFLFGYDTGIVGGVLTLTSFENDYRYGAAEQVKTNSLAVSLQQAGAFVACFAIWPVTYSIGRKKSMMLCSLIFCFGAIIQTINTHSLTAFYIARIIAGIGLGGATVVVPMFSSEMAPKELRGQIGCFFQLFFTFGIFSSYWIDYAVKVGIEESARQWQIPIGLQLVPGAMMGLGMFTLKESVRWHVQKGQLEQAWESLEWIRAGDSPAVRAEMEEIKAGVEMEMKQKEGFQFKELLYVQNFKLIATAFLVFLAQQATGATAFAYFAPQYFSLLVGNSGSRDLLLTGIFGAVKVVSCGTFVWFLSERYGRRQSFLWGAAIMAVIFMATAAVDKTHPPASAEAVDPPLTASGIATVVLIYLFVSVYNMTWGPLPWPYVSEIFPTRIREPGVATGVASQWLFNFLFTLVTPYMISSLGWITFLVWGIFNVVIFIGTYVFLKETKGLSLEEINAELSGKDGSDGQAGGWRRNKLRQSAEVGRRSAELESGGEP